MKRTTGHRAGNAIDWMIREWFKLILLAGFGYGLMLMRFAVLDIEAFTQRFIEIEVFIHNVIVEYQAYRAVPQIYPPNTQG